MSLSFFPARDELDLYSYDADGRVARRHTFTQGSDGASVLAALNTTVDYTRDLRDSVTARVVTVGTTTFRHWYEYDARGLLWKVYADTGSTRPATPDVTYTYRPSGEVSSRQFRGGTTVPLRYTIREQLERIGDPATTTYPFSARYSYHPNGTVSEAEFYSAGSPVDNRYCYLFAASNYDALNRLKGADYRRHNGSTYVDTLAHDLTGIAYDRAGNIITLRRYRETGTLIDNLTYSYPAANNRLTSVAEAVGSSTESWDAEAGSFTYDANGNLTRAGAPYALDTATYDHRNLPLSLTRAGVVTSYRYDHAGQRIAKKTGSANTEYYVLEGSATLAVFSVNSGGTASSWHYNVLAGGRVVGRQPNTGARRHYHTDLLGSTRAVVQGATVVESYDYDPWGLLMPGRTLGSGTKEGFTGKERDAETGLDYFGARYYMAALGRWSSVDPLADDFPGWSPYNYVYDNPVRLTDAFGLCPTPDGRDDGKPCVVTLTVRRETETKLSTQGRFELSSNLPDAGTLEGATLEPPTVPVPRPEGGTNSVRVAAGTYPAKYVQEDETEKRSVLRLEDRNGRTNIMVHPGNKPIHTEGCILVAESHAGPDALKGGTSRPTVNAIRKYIETVQASDGGRTPTIKVTIIDPPR